MFSLCKPNAHFGYITDSYVIINMNCLLKQINIQNQLWSLIYSVTTILLTTYHHLSLFVGWKPVLIQSMITIRPSVTSLQTNSLSCSITTRWSTAPTQSAKKQDVFIFKEKRADLMVERWFNRLSAWLWWFCKPIDELSAAPFTLQLMWWRHHHWEIRVWSWGRLYHFMIWGQTSQPKTRLFPLKTNVCQNRSLVSLNMMQMLQKRASVRCLILQTAVGLHPKPKAALMSRVDQTQAKRRVSMCRCSI